MAGASQFPRQTVSPVCPVPALRTVPLVTGQCQSAEPEFGSPFHIKWGGGRRICQTRENKADLQASGNYSLLEKVSLEDPCFRGSETVGTVAVMCWLTFLYHLRPGEQHVSHLRYRSPWVLLLHVLTESYVYEHMRVHRHTHRALLLFVGVGG